MCSLVFMLCVFLIFITLGSAGQPHSARNADYYTAGVVEFRPTIQGQTSAQMLAEHLQAYIDILQSAAANETDIVVFPEGTLNTALTLTFVPAPHDNVIPCGQASAEYADFLVRLSCAAQQVSKYVLINLTEKENCTANAAHDPRPCAANGLNIYNTNVVFDREGRVISRYRKVHIYVEARNTTQEPEFAIFETDFGVRFAHFICFDLLFYTPAQELVERYGVRDFLFPSMFYSELPFLTAVQLQQSWAWGNNVNLLAAGASFPQSGITGTGIYAGANGALAAVMVGGTGVRELYVAKVPKTLTARDVTTHSGGDIITAATGNRTNRNNNTPQTGIRLLPDPQIEHFTSELLDFAATRKFSRRLCMSELCCQFEVEVAELSHGSQLSQAASVQSYRYRIGVFQGRRSYEKQEYSDVAVCALYACANDSVASCGQLLADGAQLLPQYAFKMLHIAGDFEKAAQLLIMPNSLTDQLYSLQPTQASWKLVERGGVFNAEFNLTAVADNLLTFGIYANYYDKSVSARVGGTGALLLLVAFWSGIIGADWLC